MTNAAESNQKDTIAGEAAAQLAYAVDIVDLSKHFKRQRLGKSGYTTLKTTLLRLLFDRAKVAEHVTHVVRDLTIRIPAGSSVGIIGRNGSGKSSLLKLISGIYKPDHGSVKVNGRIAALIELGAGFHPDFTGRENLYLGGTMHGLTRAEIDDCFETIVRFAELEDVIDDAVRTYSSGMFMRLGFSLAVHTDPDILMVDEVLAVGDAAFVNKCKERIAQLRKEGKTLILVSHDLSAVERWCDEVLWLDEGEVKDRGDPRRVIDHYRQFVEKGEELELLEDREAAAPQLQEAQQPIEELQESRRWGSREVEITAVRMQAAGGESQLLFHPDQAVTIEIDYQLHEEVDDIVFGIGINRSDGLVVHGTNTDIERIVLPSVGRQGTLRYSMPRLGLLDGRYSLDIAVHRHDGYPYDYHKAAVCFAVRWALKQLGVWVPRHAWQLERDGECLALNTASDEE